MKTEVSGQTASLFTAVAGSLQYNANILLRFIKSYEKSYESCVRSRAEVVLKGELILTQD